MSSSICAQVVETHVVEINRSISTLHTLGPGGTNCERAGAHWFQRLGRPGNVVLHPTLETAVETLMGEKGAALLACGAYPEFHTLVFTNLHRLELVDSFIMLTHPMVLAARVGLSLITSVASHAAPVALIPDSVSKRITMNSNAEAALACVRGEADGCITTMKAARELNLAVVHDFGPVPMVFTIHAQRNR